MSLKDVPLTQAFNEIENQSGYSFVYTGDLLQNAKKVNIDIKDASLKDALDQCFHDQPFNYFIRNKFIILTNKPGFILNRLLDEIPPVTGIVRGPDGQPIAGVNVVIKGTKKGVVTDAYGRFTIEAEQGRTLVISNIGYNAQEIKVNGDNNFIVGLEISASQLDEVQYIAYGKSSPRFQTGNVSSIKAKDIEKQPVNNPLLALQGRVPGLFITQANGISGGGITVRIQGQNSLFNGSGPLYVVDGVPYPSEILLR